MVHVIIAIVVTALITCHHHRNHIDLIYSIYPIFVVSVLIVVCMSWWATCDTTYRTTVHGFHTVYTCAFEIAILTVPITKTLACDDGHVYMLAGISAGRPLLHLLISTSTMTTRMLLFNTFNIHYWIFWLPDRLQVDWNVLSCIFFFILDIRSRSIIISYKHKHTVCVDVYMLSCVMGHLHSVAVVVEWKSTTNVDTVRSWMQTDTSNVAHALALDVNPLDLPMTTDKCTDGYLDTVCVCMCVWGKHLKHVYKQHT